MSGKAMQHLAAAILVAGLASQAGAGEATFDVHTEPVLKRGSQGAWSSAFIDPGATIHHGGSTAGTDVFLATRAYLFYAVPDAGVRSGLPNSRATVSGVARPTAYSPSISTRTFLLRRRCSRVRI